MIFPSLLQVVDPINKLIDTVEFDAVFYSLDWHPSDHVSFIDNIKQRPIHPTSPVSKKQLFFSFVKKSLNFALSLHLLLHPVNCNFPFTYIISYDVIMVMTCQVRIA